MCQVLKKAICYNFSLLGSVNWQAGAEDDLQDSCRHPSMKH